MSIISLNTADIFNAIGGGSPLSIINSVLHPQYVIRKHKSSEVALNFSGMVSIQPSGRAQITTAPVEGGKYQSINKVKEPSIVRCAIVISGLTGFSGSIPNLFDLTFTSQSRVLETIKSMLETAEVYDIETPKETLTSYDLVDHSYEVTSQHNVSLLTISLYFQEVMQQMVVSLSGAQNKKLVAE
ncbi:phage baseplate protein [Symbiopectobacterium purcellii]|uniref:phage baseplate protein n=1 Tax=Symbiopectobacterium purcellii TaxID=2871826 RepID=UPI003F871843